MEHRMHEIETAQGRIAAIQRQMAGSVEFRGYGGAVPDAAAADLAGASL